MDLPQLEIIECEMQGFFQEYIVKLNEEQLGYTVNKLIKWVTTKSSENEAAKDSVVGFDLHK